MGVAQLQAGVAHQVGALAFYSGPKVVHGGGREFYKGLETALADPTFPLPTQERKPTMATITRFDPFNELVDDLFKGFLVRPVAYANNGEALPRVKVDVAEKNGAYTVVAELPGVKKEDIQVTIDGAEVTLAAEVKREKEVADDERVLHAERTFGKVSRSFSLPQEVDEAKAEAKFRDGVLELTLPKKAAAARKQVTIQ
jgi:HSP20 family protein